AQVPDRAPDDDVRALERDPAPRRGVAVDDEQSAVRSRSCGLARVALDDDGPGHHVLGEPGACIAADADGRALVHACAVLPGVPLDLDFDLGIEAAGERM